MYVVKMWSKIFVFTSWLILIHNHKLFFRSLSINYKCFVQYKEGCFSVFCFWVFPSPLNIRPKYDTHVISKSFLSFLIIFSVILLQLPNLSPFALLLTSHTSAPTVIPHCCPCPWVIHTCSLFCSFSCLPALSPSPFPFDHFQSCSHACGSILLVYFIYQIPCIGEIIWYFSFTHWVISLSIIFSRPISAVEKDQSSFFLSAALCSSEGTMDF